MTVLVKTNTAAKKPTGVALVPVVRQRQVKRVRKASPICGPPLTASLPVLTMLAMVAATVVAVGFTSAMVLAREYIKSSSLRYRGTCTVSSTKDMDYLVVDDVSPDMPWFGVPSVQMKVFSSPSDLISPNIMSQLLEDMAIEDRMETITVRDGQRAFQIVHDFNDNLTSIRADERCFVMDMIHDFVLDPMSLIAGFHNESKLDLSHAHSFFRAELPALSVAILSNSGLGSGCSRSNRPIYRLNLEDSLVVRKRSVTVRSTLPPLTEAAPAPTPALSKMDFVQFSGKHLHRITINNMDDIINYEMANSVQDVHPKLRAGLAPKE